MRIRPVSYTHLDVYKRQLHGADSVLRVEFQQTLGVLGSLGLPVGASRNTIGFAMDYILSLIHIFAVISMPFARIIRRTGVLRLSLETKEARSNA